MKSCGTYVIQVYGVFFSESAWTDDIKRAGLIAMANHERLHCLHDAAARDENPNNNVWAALNQVYDPDGFKDFSEAVAYASVLSDQNVGWLLHLPYNEAQQDSGAKMLGNFQEYFGKPNANGTVDGGAVGRVDGGQYSGATKAMARELLQQIYEILPFKEMKRSDYDYYVRPPL